jgi:hypothetical protein
MQGTQQIKLSDTESAFYHAGEASGLSRGLEQAAKDLRAAANHYRASVPEESREQVEPWIRPLEALATQFDTESAKARKSLSVKIAKAIETSESELSRAQKLKRAIRGALRGAKNGYTERI